MQAGSIRYRLHCPNLARYTVLMHLTLTVVGCGVHTRMVLASTTRQDCNQLDNSKKCSHMLSKLVSLVQYCASRCARALCLRFALRSRCMHGSEFCAACRIGRLVFGRDAAAASMRINRVQFSIHAHWHAQEHRTSRARQE
jgi:hypothetical protein